MKKKLYSSLVAGALVVSAAVLLISNQEKSTYEPREIEAPAESIDGAFEYMQSMRANQITGVVDPADVQAALNQIENNRKNNKATFPLSWENAGPDNIGGRTRAILVDRNNSSILYAGGVMGGLFKSTNKGASWYPLNDKFDDMAVSSLCQTVNGDIFFGTGESFIGGGGQEAFTPGFAGGGIYHSTDGETFTKILVTNSYRFVNKLQAHPTKNVAFAATNAGLFASTDGDHTSWTRVLSGNAKDVVIDKNGNALAYTSLVFRSTDPTTNNSFTRVEGVPGGSRIALAYSNSNPDFAYAIVVGQVTISGSTGDITVGSGLVGVYQSKDNGENFSQIVGKANAFFAPFTAMSIQSSQGTYDLCIAVHPTEPEHIYMGGIEFAEWSKNGGPQIVGNTFSSPFNRFGIHSDKHTIVFDTVSNPDIMYVGSDGGVSKTTNASLDNYTPINNGYQTTTFYGIAAGIDGGVLGGTQDNGTIYIDGKGNTPEAGVGVWGGDGFKCEIAKSDPKVLFVLSQFGRMGRTLNGGSNSSAIWDQRILDQMVDGEEPGITPNDIFNTPMRLWENEATGENRLYFALNNEIWMANEAVTSPNPQWFRVATIPTAPHLLEITPDGSTLFVGGFTGSRVYRIDGLDKAEWDTAALPANMISDSLTTISIKGNLPSRTLTDIEVDDNNPNRVIVTMGNYGNSSFVYMTEDAMAAVPTWRSIQGGLPRFPVYDAEISIEDPNTIILGTEYGIYAAQNGSATTPTWVEHNDGFPLVPVFQMRQVEAKRVTGGNPWRTGPVLYAGTHGRGIFRSNNFLTSVKPSPKNGNLAFVLYPNPASNNISIVLPKEVSTSNGTIRISSYNGQVVYTESFKNQKTIKVNTSELRAGSYIVTVEGDAYRASSKFVKMN